MKKKNKGFHKRKWLNPPSHYSTGSIEWGVDTESYFEDNEIGPGQPYLSLRDCSRKVDFELDTTNKKQRKNTVRKLRMIEAAAKELADLVEEYDVVT